MVLRFNQVPVYQWTHNEFSAPDPWADDKIVAWSVVVYQLVGESFIGQTPKVPRPASPQRKSIPTKCVIGIYARAHQRYRILPLALQDLWRDGQVDDQDLPKLLYYIEEPLRITDYPPGQLARVMRIYSIVFLVLTPLAGAAGSWAVLIMATLAATCFGVDHYWRSRRRRLAARWLGMLARTATPV